MRGLQISSRPDEKLCIVKAVYLKGRKEKDSCRYINGGQFFGKLGGIRKSFKLRIQTKSELSKTEAYGLAALLNSALIDRYFRTINGNTQVNATEIRTLPLLPMRDIKIIGEKIQKMPQLDPLVIEEMILDYLGINRKIKDYLQKISVCVDGDALDPPV